MALEKIVKKDKEELEFYKRVHENAKRVLWDVGFKLTNPEIIELLENTKKAVYDTGTGRIHIFYDPLNGIDYVQECVDLSVKAKENFKRMPSYNSFSLGGAVPFIEEEKEEEWRLATYDDVKRSAKMAAEYQDVIQVWDSPIYVYKGSRFETAKILDETVPQLKEIGVEEMTDDEVKHFLSDDWMHWFDPVHSPLTGSKREMSALLRSARLGATLAIASMPMAGYSAPYTPEGLLTMGHSEVLFGNCIAQTANPGIVCIHAGYPCPTEKYQMIHGSLEHNLINAAMARLNMWVTGLPTDQAGATNSLPRTNTQAYEEGRNGRNLFRSTGFHVIRQAFGFVNNTAAFNFEKFEKEIEHERNDREKINLQLDKLFIPDDPKVMEVITRRGSSLYMDDMHTLANYGIVWEDWVQKFKKMNDWPY